MKGENDRLWLTWETQRRNRTMSRIVNAKIYEFSSEYGRYLRYLLLSIKTIMTLLEEKPRVVFAQNPSIVLCFLIVIFKRPLKYRCIIDEHNAGIYPAEGRHWLLNKIAQLIVRFADLVLVSNPELAEICERWGGRACVIPDPLPDFSAWQEGHSQPISGRPLNFLFICTWAEDEPYESVIKAMEYIDDKTAMLRITGNSKGKVSQNDLPRNVKLLGYVSETDYLNELATCDAVIVLTNREKCLNCGAYEAVAMEKPGILSDTKALRCYFTDGFLFASNQPRDIASKIYQVTEELEFLRESVSTLGDKLKKGSATSKKLEAALGKF